MYRKLIVFLVRNRLGLKKGELFRFTNQNAKDEYYYFSDTNLIKTMLEKPYVEQSGVSLNWLLDDECKVEKIKGC